ncbi:hypothetical protein M422DRAFT_776022 [Sphaerobolus stellatus SS14]|nr:hypothetical protein M422DRAFT_776022 [Sphaerobolus stellatus SS14]
MKFIYITLASFVLSTNAVPNAGMPAKVAMATIIAGTSVAEATSTATAAAVAIAPAKVSNVTDTEGTQIFSTKAVGGFIKTCWVWNGTWSPKEATLTATCANMAGSNGLLTILDSSDSDVESERESDSNLDSYDSWYTSPSDFHSDGYHPDTHPNPYPDPYYPPSPPPYPSFPPPPPPPNPIPTYAKTSSIDLNSLHTQLYTSTPSTSIIMPKKSGGTPMTKDASSRVQSTQAKGSKPVGKGTFAARAQTAGDTATPKASPASPSKGAKAEKK